MPFKSTKVAVIGGFGSKAPHNIVTILDTLTMNSIASQTDDEMSVYNISQQAVVVNDRQALHVGCNKQKNRRLIEITVGVDECVTYKTVGALVEAENKATELPKYDSNRALELGGLKALTLVQSEAFEEYWN